MFRFEKTIYANRNTPLFYKLSVSGSKGQQKLLLQRVSYATSNARCVMGCLSLGLKRQPIVPLWKGNYANSNTQVCCLWAMGCLSLDSKGRVLLVEFLPLSHVYGRRTRLPSYYVTPSFSSLNLLYQQFTNLKRNDQIN